MKALILIHHPTQRPRDAEEEKKRALKEEVDRKIEKMRIERVVALEDALPGVKMSSKDKRERNAILGDTRDKSKSKEKRHDSDDSNRRKSPRKEKSSDRKGTTKHISERPSRTEKKGERPLTSVPMHIDLDLDEKKDGEGEEVRGEKEEMKMEEERESGKREEERKEGEEKKREREGEEKKKWTKSVWSLSPESGEVAIWR